MRRRAIFDTEETFEIINKCEVCHMAMVDENNLPYLVPMNFGFEDGVIYLHSAQEGHKMKILRKKPDVCIEFSTDYVLRYQSEEVACSWSMRYRSILAFGKVEFIEDYDEKMRCMNKVMKHYAGKEFPYNMPAIREVCVYIVRPERFTGRAFGS